jgi:hypothetical protein
MKDAPVLAEEPKEQLVRDHPIPRPTDDLVWEMLQACLRP